MNKSHFLFWLVGLCQSLQQVLKVFLVLDGLSVTPESDCRLSLTFFFTSLHENGKKNQASAMQQRETNRTSDPPSLLPGQVKNRLHHVGSVLGAGFAEQGSIHLQGHDGHPGFYFHTRELRILPSTPLGGGVPLALANFSPSRLLTQVPLEPCSRRSTLFPTTHIEILSSAESWAKKQQHVYVVKTSLCFVAEVMCIKRPAADGESVHAHLDLVHPRSHVQEAAFRSDIIEEEDAVSLAEVGPGNAAKPTARGAGPTSDWGSFLSKCPVLCLIHPLL